MYAHFVLIVCFKAVNILSSFILRSSVLDPYVLDLLDPDP
jgi:hypothetical protein